MLPDSIKCVSSALSKLSTLCEIFIDRSLFVCYAYPTREVTNMDFLGKTVAALLMIGAVIYGGMWIFVLATH